MVFSNSIIPQTVRRFLFLATKESRIYAGSGVSQTPNEFTKEKERLAAEQLSYAGQTNQLYFDKDNFSSEAYVALADWSDRYEYAIIMEDASTILYVYLENMTRDDLHMEETYLPAYFQDNNQPESTEESMTAEHRSFYAFKIGSQYVDCMDLADGPFARISHRLVA
ncbi:MAG TPA: hypothetical protein H9742_05715 [Candidatus Acetatifactor stercoripullorum]|uniref:Uncharacterized protein n=1 Tax=Candidatus Acetatifactor stercoripullorum TaxID=2838414 RepID=A0A9D1R4T0_9FIRM|nr:hypothetical protein [uncultured Acetatifactor sp.]HIW81017.1 hypothetical protein [Candidatus Acetatifactor stercoripullorum]